MAGTSCRMGRVVTVGIVGLMAVAGCSTTGSLGRGDLPTGVQVVGGGFMINWDAPTNGTAYLVETMSGKIVETRSVEEGDTYDFEMSLDDEDVVKAFENAFGVPMEKARFVLYFKPAERQSGT